MKIPAACSPSKSQEGTVKTPYSALPLGTLAVAVAWLHQSQEQQARPQTPDANGTPWGGRRKGRESAETFPKDIALSFIWELTFSWYTPLQPHKVW